MNIVEEDWNESTFLKKNSLLLIVFYLYEKESLKLDYIIKIVELFSFKDFEDDFKIIKQDWCTIQEKIKEGKAHELSE
jgi:DNA mismatch repair protein MutH